MYVGVRTRTIRRIAQCDFLMQSRKAMDDGKKEFSDLSTELRKTQEALSVANLTFERQRKIGEIKATPSSQKEAQLQKEVDKCMVCIYRIHVTNFASFDLSFAEPPQVFNM